MKQPLFLLLLLVLILFSEESCVKESAPSAGIYYDSGQYDPSSYFPLKWGAEWQYVNRSGSRLKVICGAHYTDTLRQYQNSYVYHYLLLNTIAIDSPFTGYRFGYDGKFNSGSKVGRMCIKGSPFTEYFMDDRGGIPGLVLASFDCGMNGPSNSNYYTCHDTGLTVNNFQKVNSFCFFNWPAIRQEDLPVWIDGKEISAMVPFMSENGYQLEIDYYAKGVGLVGKELIDSTGKVIDWIRLDNYFIPK